MEMRHTSRLICGSIYLQQTVKLTTATARNHICAKTYVYRANEVPRRRRLYMKARYKQRHTETIHQRATKTWKNHPMKPRLGKEDTETRKHRDWDARASRYRGTQALRHSGKESLSQANTQTQKEQEEEPRLDGEVTKTKKENGAEERRRRLSSLLLKK